MAFNTTFSTKIQLLNSQLLVLTWHKTIRSKLTANNSLLFSTTSQMKLDFPD